jgi:hypothetical protein
MTGEQKIIGVKVGRLRVAIEPVKRDLPISPGGGALRPAAARV